MKKLFSEDELQVIGEHPGPLMMYFFGGSTPKRNTPITPRENFLSALKRDGNAMWIPTFSDILNVQGRINIDHIARAEVMDLTPLLTEEEKAAIYAAAKEIPVFYSGNMSLGIAVLCRLAKAKEMLRMTDLPVSDICFGCGFTDLSNFSRYFRREEGCSPSAYRVRKLPECVD